MSDETETGYQVLQEGRFNGLADPADYCPRGDESRRGFEWLLAVYIRLLWLCENCGRFWRIATAVLIGGTMRTLSAQESEDWR